LYVGDRKCKKDEYEKLAELVEKSTKTISAKNILSEYQKTETATIIF
jgi:hypothetical protein